MFSDINYYCKIIVMTEHFIIRNEILNITLIYFITKILLTISVWKCRPKLIVQTT